jgi:ribonuclease P/MRP protein subunit POP3
MVALAAQSQSTDKAVRLVGFSKACEDRLSAALGIPRVSSIGLREDAPLAKGLVDFVRERVKPVEVPWLREAKEGKFLETRIAAVPTKVGNKKARLS